MASAQDGRPSDADTGSPPGHGGDGETPAAARSASDGAGAARPPHARGRGRDHGPTPPERGARILLAEDDFPSAELLRAALGARGHRVWHARDAAETLRLLDEVDPDVIVVDLNLPGRSGLALCADLRGRTDAPIVVCSATRRRDDAGLAFTLGAVDFVARPFQMPDLEARIERAGRLGARRRTGDPAGPPPSQQRIGHLVVDRAARRVSLAGRPVHLTPTEYRLLEVLAAHAGRAVPTAALVREIWGYDDPTLAPSLATHARRLRAKLGAHRPSGLQLAAVRAFGFRLAEDPPGVP